MSYFCFNPDVFYWWLLALDIPVPAWEFDGRMYLAWWGKRDQIAGMSGYACGTGGAGTSVSELDRLAIADANAVVDVYHNPAFQRLASFGSPGHSEVDVFHFDLSAPKAGSH
jgi:hypothetical protein